MGALYLADSTTFAEGTVSLDTGVKGIVVEFVHEVSPEASAQDAAASMVEKDVGCLVVSGDEGPIGMVTQRDILRKVTAVRADPSRVRVRDIMSTPLIAVAPEATVGDTAKKMVDNHVKRLAVMREDGKFVGLVTMTDIVKWMAKQKELSDSLLNYLNYDVP